MKRFFLFLILPVAANAQFAPAAGQPGTSAIKKDSSAIVGWATGCTVTRGYQDISTPSGGYTSVGDNTSAIGAADGVNVVSLGDGGSAILTFQSPIKNGTGPDFCVFENSFDPGFLELAFVEVSSDGMNFTRFPATSNVQNTVQIGPFDTSSDPTRLNNLAGKYIANYGTPFDLQELQGTPGLDIDNITQVKIIDVVGCIQTQYATVDKDGKKINDPWSTPFASGGFDLDAVGVIHQQPVSVAEQLKFDQSLTLVPSVTNGKLQLLNTGQRNLQVEVSDVSGKQFLQFKTSETRSGISLENVPNGIYFVKISDGTSSVTRKVIKAE